MAARDRERESEACVRSLSRLWGGRGEGQPLKRQSIYPKASA